MHENETGDMYEREKMGKRKQENTAGVTNRYIYVAATRLTIRKKIKRIRNFFFFLVSCIESDFQRGSLFLRTTGDKSRFWFVPTITWSFL